MRRRLALVAMMACLGATPAYASYISFHAHDAACGHLGNLGGEDYTLLTTAWNPGPNQGRLASGNPAPGSATWSIMGAGLVDVSGFDPGHRGAATLDLVSGLAVPGWVLGDYVNAITAMLNLWDAVSGWTNLGQVADGGVNMGASAASGGHLGDIRIGALPFDGAFGVLAHNFQPGTEALFGPGGTIAGDSHYDSDENWVDDPTDAGADPDFDLYTVFLHEFGHALGLGHSTDPTSVMFAFYGGARRTLTADDIAGIQAIYGPAQEPPGVVPEPASLLLLASGLAGLAARRKRSKKST